MPTGKYSATMSNRRVLAAIGIIWVAIVLVVLLLQEGIPVLWKVAWAVYGVFALADMSLMLVGKDEPWSKQLRVAQLVAFGVATLLFVIGALQ
jgi:hypothetical protein